MLGMNGGKEGGMEKVGLDAIGTYEADCQKRRDTLSSLKHARGRPWRVRDIPFTFVTAKNQYWTYFKVKIESGSRN